MSQDGGKAPIVNPLPSYPLANPYLTWKLLSQNVLAGPVMFAASSGFSGVRDFLAANPSIATTEVDSSLMGSDPAIFQTSKKSGDIDVPTWLRASPWQVDQTVNVVKEPAT